MSNWTRPGTDIEHDACELDHAVRYVDDATVECEDCGQEFPIHDHEVREYHQDRADEMRESASDRY